MFADLHEVLLERLRAARLGDPATVQQPLNAHVGAECAQLQANAVFAILRVLPGTGYLIAYDDPVGVARELLSFLS